MNQSPTIEKLAPALVAALAEIGGVAKSADNAFFKSKYATLEAVIEASKPILTLHKLTVLQGGGSYVSGALAITTRILHESGEWIESTMEIPLAKADPQGAGSAVTYGRRYALMAILNMPAVDDDGEAAMQRKPTQDAPITAEQAGDIQALIEDVGADKPKFLAYLKVQSIAQIPAFKYQAAVAALEAKRAK